MRITNVSPGYCDPASYGVLVQFVLDGKEGSSYFEFSSSCPNGQLEQSVVSEPAKVVGGILIEEQDVPIELTASQENIARIAARKYYRDALIFRSTAEQRASGLTAVAHA